MVKYIIISAAIKQCFAVFLVSFIAPLWLPSVTSDLGLAFNLGMCAEALILVFVPVPEFAKVLEAQWNK